jgi:hypothetical protein
VTLPKVEPPLVVIDAANVVGSVPDGWWRDRRAATERLCGELRKVAGDGLPADSGVPEWATRPPVDLVVVVEGAARSVPDVPGLRIVRAPRSGDDAIVELARRADNRRVLVVTADRALRDRVAEHGAVTVGPHAVRRSDRPTPRG